MTINDLVRNSKYFVQNMVKLQENFGKTSQFGLWFKQIRKHIQGSNLYQSKINGVPSLYRAILTSLKPMSSACCILSGIVGWPCRCFPPFNRSSTSLSFLVRLNSLMLRAESLSWILSLSCLNLGTWNIKYLVKNMVNLQTKTIVTIRADFQQGIESVS